MSGPVLQPRRYNAHGLHAYRRFGLFPLRSPLLGESRLLSLPRGNEMFQFPPLAPARLCIQRTVTGRTPAGLPHSDISGSKRVCRSPELIAAYHVLHRLLVPRHPPCALGSLTEPFGARSALTHLFRMWLSKIRRGLASARPERARAPLGQRPGETPAARFRRNPRVRGLEGTGMPPTLFRLVEITGIEPVTSGLQSRRSPN